MARGEYLLEVRSEEIPARMLEPGVRELATRVFEDLMSRGLGPSEVETGFTPRRLVLILAGLPEREPDREEQVMGPPVRAAYNAEGAPTPALLGFAKRCGVTPAELSRVTTDKGEYLAATRKIEGRPTPEVLAEIVPRVLAGISWAKTMRWGSGDGPWVRPIHGIVSLLDGEVVPFDLFGIQAGNQTIGHPTLSPEPFQVDGLDAWRRELGTRKLEVRPAERKRILLDTMRSRAEALGGRLVDDPALLDKLTAICEIPGVMEGRFDDTFLELPAEVLATAGDQVVRQRPRRRHPLDAAVDAGGFEDADEDGKGPLSFDFPEVDHLLIADVADDDAMQLHLNEHADFSSRDRQLPTKIARVCPRAGVHLQYSRAKKRHASRELG